MTGTRAAGAGDHGGGPIRVVVADDHSLIREGVRALLGSVADMELVGEAADGAEAVAVVARTAPDVVLMDLHMPGVDGVAATRAIAADHPGVAVLVVSMLDDDASVFAALKAGARGYVLKGAEPDELQRAVRAVASGDAIFGPGIAERVLTLFRSPQPPAAEPRPATGAGAFPELTDREREILDHLARGRSNAAIAGELYLSPRTVANHVSSILGKLHAADRTEAAIRARDAGLGRG
ncbi:MAG: response regulator transcription factor [Acidimicrobiales bacterium]